MLIGCLQLTLLAACGGSPEREDRRPLIPEVEPPAARELPAPKRSIDASSTVLADRVDAAVAALSLEVLQGDSDGWTLRYHGKPQEFVDCGVITMRSGARRDSFVSYAAHVAEQSVNFHRFTVPPLGQGGSLSGYEFMDLLRRTSLRIDVSVRAVAEGEGSRITLSSHYRMARLITRLVEGMGNRSPYVLDHAEFAYGDTGTVPASRYFPAFDCVATGEFEQRLLSVLAGDDGAGEARP